MEHISLALTLTAFAGLIYGYACGSNSGDLLDGLGCGLGAGFMVGLLALVMTVPLPYALAILGSSIVGGGVAGITPDTSKIKRFFNSDLNNPGHKSRKFRKL